MRLFIVARDSNQQLELVDFAFRAGSRMDLVAPLTQPSVFIALHVEAGIKVECATTAIKLRAKALLLSGNKVDAGALHRLHPQYVAHGHTFGRLFLFPDDWRLRLARRGVGTGLKVGES